MGRQHNRRWSESDSPSCLQEGCSPARSVRLRSGPWDGCCVNAEAGAGNWRGMVAEHDVEGRVVAVRFEAPECWRGARVEVEDQRGRRDWGNPFVLPGAPPSA